MLPLWQRADLWVKTSMCSTQLWAFTLQNKRRWLRYIGVLLKLLGPDNCMFINSCYLAATWWHWRNWCIGALPKSIRTGVYCFDATPALSSSTALFALILLGMIPHEWTCCRAEHISVNKSIQSWDVNMPDVFAAWWVTLFPPTP